MTLARISYKTLERSGGSGHPCVLVLGRGGRSNISLLSIIFAVRFCVFINACHTEDFKLFCFAFAEPQLQFVFSSLSLGWASWSFSSCFYCSGVRDLSRIYRYILSLRSVAFPSSGYIPSILSCSGSHKLCALIP